MTYSLRVPALPVGRLIEWYMGDNNHSAPSLCGERLTPTLRQVHLYNKIAELTNTSLFTTALSIVVTANSNFKLLGSVLTLLPLWVHVSGHRCCGEIIAQNTGPISGSLLGLQSSQMQGWECFRFDGFGVVQWRNPLPTLTQEELDSFPECFDKHFFAPSIPESVSKTGFKEKFQMAWLGVHEKNRPYLRGFFSERAEQIKEMSAVKQQRLFSGLFHTHLANLNAQDFFSKPQQENDIGDFLERASAGCVLSPILEE